MDLGDKKIQICVLDARGRKVREGSVTNTAAALRKYFQPYVVVAMEMGRHSPSITRLLASLGCQVLIENFRKLRMNC